MLRNIKIYMIIFEIWKASVQWLLLVRRRCPVAFVTGASNWYWLTVGQGLLSLQQVKVEGGCCYFFSSFVFFHFSASSLSVSCISSTFFFFISFPLSLRDDTEWLTMVDVLLNPNTINQSIQWLLRYERLKNLKVSVTYFFTPNVHARI